MAHFIALLAGALERRGHSISILSFRLQYPRLFFPGKTQIDEGRDLAPVSAHPLLNSINPFSWIRAFFWMKSRRPHLVVFNYWMPFFLPCYATLAFLSRTFLRVDTLCLAHNIVPHEKKPGDRFLSRVGLRSMSFFIVMSETVRQDLLRFRPHANHHLVPHPVYTYFPPPIPRKQAKRNL